MTSTPPAPDATARLALIERAPRPKHSIMLHDLARQLEGVEVDAILVTWASKQPDGSNDLGSRGLGSPASLTFLASRFLHRLLGGQVTHLTPPVSEIPPAAPHATGAPETPDAPESP